MLWPKKIHTRNLITKKNFLRLENSPPPHNFSNGPSLSNKHSAQPGVNKDQLEDLFNMVCNLTDFGESRSQLLQI